MNIRTHMAYELFRNLSTHTNDIALEKDDYLHEVHTTKVIVKNSNGEKAIGKPIGTYTTVESKDILSRDIDIQKYTAKIIAGKLKELIEKQVGKKEFSTLIVGLGNKNMTADALGNFVSDDIIVTRHIYNVIENKFDKSLQEVSSLAPSVMGETGIEVFDIIKGVVEKIKPDIIIAVDSLASQTVSRISTSFQLSDSGIVPGGGLNNARMKLDKQSLGVPVIAIGVPLVVYAETICVEVIDKMFNNAEVEKEAEKVDDVIKSAVSDVLGDLVVTPKDIDVIVRDCAYILSIAINLAIHHKLNIDDVIAYIH